MTYLALDELVRRHTDGSVPAPSPQEPLTRYEHRVFSQNGEDGVLSELLRRIGVVSHWFVEFGIERGVEGNCVFLADVIGWSGLFLEAQQDAYNERPQKVLSQSSGPYDLRPRPARKRRAALCPGRRADRAGRVVG